jgi:soluble lytic murein transglycosylase-like protein
MMKLKPVILAVIALSVSVPAWADDFTEIISAVSAETGVPVYAIRACIKTESNFNPKAVSKAGAIGLMQVKPAAAIDVGIDPGENGGNLYDPYLNVLAGARYLKLLHRKYGSWGTAFTAYYMGMKYAEKIETLDERRLANLKKHLSRLKRHLDRYGVDAGEAVDEISGSRTYLAGGMRFNVD